MNILKWTDHVEMLEACTVIKKFFCGRLVGRCREGRQRKRLSEDGRVGVQGRSRRARERNNCNEGLHHEGVGK